MLNLLRLAAKVAYPIEDDIRNFLIGCIGIRYDNVIVSSKNIPNRVNIRKDPFTHAEGRVLKKLGKGGTLYVSRVSKKDRTLAMAKPCIMCQSLIRSYSVKKVFYSISESEYGVWIP